jgi:hypothetical protein
MLPTVGGLMIVQAPASSAAPDTGQAMGAALVWLPVDVARFYLIQECG